MYREVGYEHLKLRGEISDPGLLIEDRSSLQSVKTIYLTVFRSHLILRSEYRICSIILFKDPLIIYLNEYHPSSTSFVYASLVTDKFTINHKLL